MSAGGGQGTVRYALMLDDQATAKLNTFKNSLTQLGTGTTNVQRNIQGFTAQLTKQSQAFTAGINPIKQQGSALTTLTTNLKTHTTQMTSVGTKIKDTTSKFAGFATGLSTTTSGILQLNAGFRDYGDSQIAVDKAQRKLSLSQEALNKATDKLNSLTKKGVTSGKEFAQAQLDVKQAQDGLAISTQLVGERQEDMFDAQTQFVASVIPITLGAVGTLGSAYKDLGLNSSKLTGIFSKLGGGIKGVIPSLAGIGTAAAGSIPSVNNLGSSISGLKGNLLSIGAIAAVGIAGVIVVFDSLSKMMKDLKDVSSGTITPIKALGNEFDRWTKIDFSTIETSLNTIVRSVGPVAPALRLAEPALKNLVKAQKEELTVSGQLKAAQDKYNSALETYNNAIKSRWKGDDAAAKKALDLTKANLDGFTTLSKVAKGTDNVVVALNKYNSGIQNTITLTQSELNIISRRNEAMAEARQQDIDVAAALGEVITKTKTAADDAKRQAEAIKLLDTALNKTIPSFLKFAEAGAASAQATKLVGDMVKLTKDRMIEWNPAAGASADIMSTIDDVLLGLPAKQASWTGQIERSTKAIEDAKKKMEEFQKQVAEGVKAVGVTFGVKDNASKIMDDIRKNIEKDSRKKIDVKLQLRTDKASTLVGFNDFLETATTMNEGVADDIVKGIIKTIDEKFKGAKGSFAGLRAQLEAAMGDPNTVQLLKDNLAKGDYTAAGQKVGSDVSKGIQDFFGHGAGLDFGEGGGSGIVVPVAAPVIPKPITTEFDSGISTLKTNVANIGKIKPQISLMNNNAMSAISTVEGEIKALTKLKPQISLQNRNAINAIQTVEEEIKKLGNLKPEIKVKFSGEGKLQATGSAQLAGSGSIKIAQQGMHELLKKDTTIVAHAGERVDIGKPEQARDDRRGGAGGDVFNITFRIDGNDIVNTREFKRQIKRESGTNRWRHG